MTTTRSGSAVDGVVSRATFGEPAPSLRRPRNLPGAVLGVLIVVVCALAVASLASRSGSRTQVLLVARPVPAGARLAPSDLQAAGVSASHEVSGIRASQLGELVGQYATHDLVPGTLLVRAEVSPAPPSGQGSAIVGLDVKDGDLPSSLAPEDQVELVSASSAGTDAAPTPGTVLVPDAVVRSVTASSDGQSSLVSVAIPQADAAVVVGANATEAISLVVVGG